MQAIKYGEKSFQEADKIQDIEVMIQSASLLTIAYAFRGEFFKIPNIASRAIELLEKEKREEDSFDIPLNPYAYLLTYCGYSSVFVGDTQAGLLYHGEVPGRG